MLLYYNHLVLEMGTRFYINIFSNLFSLTAYSFSFWFIGPSTKPSLCVSIHVKLHMGESILHYFDEGKKMDTQGK